MKFILLTATDGNSPVLIGFGQGGTTKVMETDNGTELYDGLGDMVETVKESCRTIKELLTATVS